MASTKVLDQPRPALVAMSFQDIVRIFCIGLVIGIVIYAVHVALDRYVFTPALCEQATGTLERCENKEVYAATIATLLAAVGGLFALVRLRIYRPLLVVIFATASLWGVIGLTSSLAWWLSALAVALIFGIAYASFAWLARIRNFYIALGLSIVLLVAVRLVFMA
ncbi:MAG TPA: hypothetical protein VGE13_03475 [Candidatus Saccharimonadales bacterium]